MQSLPDRSPAPPLSDDARDRLDRQLFARRDHDRRAREMLIERFLPLARSVARRYDHSGEPFDDLVQVASLALVRAIDRYDPARGYAFSSFAVPTIAGELKRYFRDRTWAIRPPRDLQERTLRVQNVANELTAALDRAPTVAELAEAMQCSDEAILETLQASRARGTVSLDAPIRHDESGSDTVLQDTLGSREDGYAQAETRADLDDLLRLVSPRARVALRLRYEDDLTQSEIGELLGVSQMQVSRIIRAAIEQLGTLAEHKQHVGADRQPIAA